MPINPKETWPVVDLVMTATGFTGANARELLRQLQPEHYSKLFIVAQRWKVESKQRAVEMFAEAVGEVRMPILIELVKQAQKPIHELEAERAQSKKAVVAMPRVAKRERKSTK